MQVWTVLRMMRDGDRIQMPVLYVHHAIEESI